MMTRRKFLRASSGLFVPAVFGVIKARAADVLLASRWNRNIAVAAGGSPALVQSKWSRGSSSSQSVTLNGTTSGNLVIVIAQIVGTTAGLAAGDVTDGVASYTLDEKTTSLQMGNWLYGSWSRVLAASGNITITCNPTGSAPIAAINMCAYEVSGLTSKVYDSGAIATGTGTSASSGTFNTAAAGIIVAVEGESTGGAGITHTAGTNFSISDSGAAHEDDNSGSFASGCAEHRVTSGALTGTSATVTIPSQTWAILAAAYK